MPLKSGFHSDEGEVALFDDVSETDVRAVLEEMIPAADANG